MTDVPVSQEAREVVADYGVFRLLPGLVAEGIRAGRNDGNDLVQAFAKFEQSIRQQAERDVIARMGFEDRERKLREALHDAINAPKGVVPASAEAFYDPALCALREMQTSLPNTVRYLALKETPDAQ